MFLSSYDRVLLNHLIFQTVYWLTRMQAFNPAISQQPTVWEAIGIPSRGAQLHKAINQGLPFEVYHRLAELSGMDKHEIASLLKLAPATLQRRAKQKKFTVDEGDKFFRLAQIISAAIELFEGDTEKALEWLKKPARGLALQRPIEMAATSAQSVEVLDHIGRLEQGVFV